MRLTCPNCGAQYEVPDGVIPPEGRDVQCSNCGDTWYQTHPDAAAPDPEPEIQQDFDDADLEAEALEEEEPEAPQVQDAAPEPDQYEPEPEPAIQDEDYAEDDEEAFSDEDDEDGFDEDPADESPLPRAKGLDPAIFDILRAEAEREQKLRSEETGESLESQPELGLEEVTEDEPARRARQARERMARMQGEDPKQVNPDPSGSRRDLLPDIEEINSTLRSTSDAEVSAVQAPGTAAISGRKPGFARGFALTIIVAVILGVIYQSSPQIAQAVPQADPMLSAYVALVDQARLWLNGLIAPLLN
ncbi:MAG: zinc-ribbon domain-containing protein [Rhodobacteraceae bacterium]|nr:zinc-ribbon domain-containing protein [Paracoccaceae bacterium]